MSGQDPFGSLWCPGANPSGLTALEVASGLIVGQGVGRAVGSGPSGRPIEVLRRQAAELLEGQSCIVAFSGGRDSSALLALLVAVANEEGLAQPIPVTARWDDDEASDESEWQEEVIRQIGVEDWEILRPGNDLDLLGHEAKQVLEQGGLLWPPPAYALLPLIRMARGGVFLSGEGGDEAFGLWPYGRLWAAVRRRQLPGRADLIALSVGCMPRKARRRVWERQLPPYQTWLRPAAYRALAVALADDQSDDPLRWDRYQAVSRQRRAVDLTVDTLQKLCSMEDSRFVAPFLDVEFLAALAKWGGPLGRGDRTAVMTELFGDVLPGRVLSRTSKASFAGVFWGPESREFVLGWDGSGLGEDLVDPEALRTAWLADRPVYGSALPLHAAWLSEARQRSNGSPDVTP